MILRLIMTVTSNRLCFILLSAFFEADCGLVDHRVVGMLVLPELLNANHCLWWASRNIGFRLLPLLDVIYSCLIVLLIVLARNQHRRVIAVGLIIHL